MGIGEGNVGLLEKEKQQEGWGLGIYCMLKTIRGVPSEASVLIYINLIIFLRKP